MSTPFSSDPQAIRLSDDERVAAMEHLGSALTEGRLTMAEYDERCQAVARSQFRGELNQLFSDLPAMAARPTTDIVSQRVYTENELMEYHRRHRSIRLGIMMLAMVAFIPAAMISEAFGGFMFTMIPVLWVLLYVLKVGPASWYTPSPNQLEVERLRALRMQEAQRAAEVRAQYAVQQAQRRAERQRIAGELTNDAMYFAKRSMDRFKK